MSAGVSALSLFIYFCYDLQIQLQSGLLFLFDIENNYAYFTYMPTRFTNDKCHLRLFFCITRRDAVKFSLRVFHFESGLPYRTTFLYKYRDCVYHAKCIFIIYSELSMYDESSILINTYVTLIILRYTCTHDR